MEFTDKISNFLERDTTTSHSAVLIYSFTMSTSSLLSDSLLKYIKSHYGKNGGKNLVSYNGYLYNENGGRNGKVYYICNRRGRGCKGRLVHYKERRAGILG